MSLLLLLGEEVEPVPPVQLISVREKPPLRLHVEIETPSGRFYRWGSDESDPANIVSDIQFSSTAPGGFETFSCKLARRPGVDYSDLERLSTVRVFGPGGELAWEGRLERAPRTSGNEFSITPSAVGWQAHLEDDKTAREIYVDRDQSKWSGPSASRKISQNATYAITDGASNTDSAAPTIRTGFTGPWTTAPGRPLSEAWYDALGLEIGSIFVLWSKNANINVVNDWTWQAFLSSDASGTSVDVSGNLEAAGPGTSTVNSTGSRKFAALQLQYGNTAAGDEREYAIDWAPLVFGDHGLTDRGSGTFFASDVVAHVVPKYAPLLRVTDDSVEDTAFGIPQLAFHENTTAAEIVKQANRFHLNDWMVWEDKTFYYHQRGNRGRSWRARIAPAQLEETGPQIDRLWNSVQVTYQDVDGTSKTVGPPNSSADTESADLEDTDSENPATKLGIRRTEQLSMGTSTAAGATEVGRRFLLEQALLDSSGRAQLVGHVEDDHGVLHPAWKVRAGDTITFVDSADNQTARRIVKADYSHSTRTTSIDLDSPPEGLAATLERLGVVLVGQGFTS